MQERGKTSSYTKHTYTHTHTFVAFPYSIDVCTSDVHPFDHFSIVSIMLHIPTICSLLLTRILTPIYGRFFLQPVLTFTPHSDMCTVRGGWG